MKPALYVRFEIYIPVLFKTKKTDPASKRTYTDRHALDEKMIMRFIHGAKRKYGGATRVNPVSRALFKGWWKPKKADVPVTIDYLTYVFILVPLDEAETAVKYFDTWRARFTKDLGEDVVLVQYFEVNTIGDFF